MCLPHKKLLIFHIPGQCTQTFHRNIQRQNIFSISNFQRIEVVLHDAMLHWISQTQLKMGFPIDDISFVKTYCLGGLSYF